MSSYPSHPHLRRHAERTSTLPPPTFQTIIELWHVTYLLFMALLLFFNFSQAWDVSGRWFSEAVLYCHGLTYSLENVSLINHLSPFMWWCVFFFVSSLQQMWWFQLKSRTACLTHIQALMYTHTHTHLTAPFTVTLRILELLLLPENLRGNVSAKQIYWLKGKFSFFQPYF